MAARIVTFPSPEELRRLLRYEPDTGSLFWLPRPREVFVSKRGWSVWNTRFANKEALTAISEGYRVGNINYKLCMAHRVVWAIVHGQWPDEDVDHINGDRADNRISNLRAANRTQNNMNSGRRSDNTSGYRGVYFSKQQGQWHARVHFNRKAVHVGFFDTAEAAHIAYCEAAKKYHGEFVRTQ